MTRALNPLYQIRRLYDWTMKWSDHPSASWALGVFSTVEGIFFPIPIDPFLLALSAGNPKKSLKYAAIAAGTSIIGGSIGYLLGYWLWEHMQDFFFQNIFAENKFSVVIKQFQDNAFVAIFLASFTPIPYKVFALAGGVAHINFLTFVFASILGRSLRFFSIGILFYFWGASIKTFIEKHFNALTVVLSIAIVGAVLILRY